MALCPTVFRNCVTIQSNLAAPLDVAGLTVALGNFSTSNGTVGTIDRAHFEVVSVSGVSSSAVVELGFTPSATYLRNAWDATNGTELTLGANTAATYLHETKNTATGHLMQVGLSNPVTGTYMQYEMSGTSGFQWDTTDSCSGQPIPLSIFKGTYEVSTCNNIVFDVGAPAAPTGIQMSVGTGATLMTSTLTPAAGWVLDTTQNLTNLPGPLNEIKGDLKISGDLSITGSVNVTGIRTIDIILNPTVPGTNPWVNVDPTPPGTESYAGSFLIVAEHYAGAGPLPPTATNDATATWLISRASVAAAFTSIARLSHAPCTAGDVGYSIDIQWPAGGPPQMRYVWEQGGIAPPLTQFDQYLRVTTISPHNL